VTALVSNLQTKSLDGAVKTEFVFMPIIIRQELPANFFKRMLFIHVFHSADNLIAVGDEVIEFHRMQWLMHLHCGS
jgi:hypothetical protein